MDEIVDKKLKVGLVSVEKNQKKQTVKPTGKKKNKTVKKKEIVEKKKIETKPKKVEKKESKMLSLDDLEQSISRREPEILVSKNSEKRSKNSELRDKLLGKKKLSQSEDHNVTKDNSLKVKNKESKFDDPLDYEIDNDVVLEDRDDSSDELVFKALVEKDGAEGLPSGYKLGVEDGDVVAKWDPSNREPEYPEAALLRGMQGKVKLKMQIDETGKVSSVYIEKGSGVPEINEAIEKIARTWKIYLNKNGLNIKGNVTLEYSFKLVGTSN